MTGRARARANPFITPAYRAPGDKVHFFYCGAGGTLCIKKRISKRPLTRVIYLCLHKHFWLRAVDKKNIYFFFIF